MPLGHCHDRLEGTVLSLKRSWPHDRFLCWIHKYSLPAWRLPFVSKWKWCIALWLGHNLIMIVIWHEHLASLINWDILFTCNFWLNNCCMTPITPGDEWTLHGLSKWYGWFLKLSIATVVSFHFACSYCSGINYMTNWDIRFCQYKKLTHLKAYYEIITGDRYKCVTSWKMAYSDVSLYFPHFGRSPWCTTD